MTEQLGDQPVERQYADTLNLMMSIVDGAFNGEHEKRKVGVVMLVFPYEGHEGRCNFISNGANRADLVVLFKEMIARFEGQPETKGST